MLSTPEFNLSGQATPKDPACPAQGLLEKWRRGEAGLEELLPHVCHLAPLDQVEVLAQDQQERWQKGERIAAEQYLQRYPTIAAEEMAGCDLVFGEYLL